MVKANDLNDIANDNSVASSNEHLSPNSKSNR